MGVARWSALVATAVLSTTGLADAAPIYTLTAPGITSLTLAAGTYDIVAAGAGGGSAFGKSGGLGAIVSDQLIFTGAEMLTLMVGGRGVDGAPIMASTGAGFSAGGGGGGSFVIGPASTPLMIAGGGGGAGIGGARYTGIGHDGGAIESVGGAGGFQGAQNRFYGGSGGGGLYFNGNTYACFYSFESCTTIGGISRNTDTPDVTGGRSFLNGGSGGTPQPYPQAYGDGSRGGFGGGGASSSYSGGGGGGYGGGAGGAGFQGGSFLPGADGGFGGSSYDAGANPKFSLATTAADGFITITLVASATPAAMPEPGSLGLLGATILGLIAARTIPARLFTDRAPQC